MKSAIEMKLGFDPKPLALRLLTTAAPTGTAPPVRVPRGKMPPRERKDGRAVYTTRKREKLRQSILACVQGWEMEHPGVQLLVEEESKASGVPARAIVSRCRLQPAVMARFRVMRRASTELGLSELELGELFHCTRWNVAYALGRG